MERTRVNLKKEINNNMDILDQIFNAQKESRKDKVQNFLSIFEEESIDENVAMKTATAKAKQIEDMERLKLKHEKEIEDLKKRQDRENDRLAGEKERETTDDAIAKKRESQSEEVSEGKLVSNIQDIIDAVMKKVNQQIQKEISKNQEKGIGMLNTIGSFVGYKVTDKKQEKGRLFLKFGEEVEEERDYKKEYENYQGKPEQIKRRAKRNEARRLLKNRKGIKGKDVHHKDNNPMNNDKDNLSIVSQKFNRTEPRNRVNAEWIKAAAKKKGKK
tara:strand:+ start:31418 stop:32236 length:819 start_codon:yes stop_codon:yes gene_type:complete